ncbi:MAG: UbiA family prenyltransferase [Bacteroidales bacterium]|nr:UbiA family prenyltransferase [Bacteroidales bacterium]
MPFALVGYFLGATQPGFGFSMRTFLLMLACMVFARSAAMAFNRYADVSFDSLNPRTAGREIPAGKVTRRNALAFVIASSLLFMAAVFLNRLTS